MSSMSGMIGPGPKSDAKTAQRAEREHEPAAPAACGSSEARPVAVSAADYPQALKQKPDELAFAMPSCGDGEPIAKHGSGADRDQD